MNEHLVFILCGPMGAFGTYAGQERRGSDIVPSRSAILGLLGAALGIERTDSDRQAELLNYRVGVRPLTESLPLRDYHTVQTIPSKIKHPDSRRAAFEELEHVPNTIITLRDYRTDVAFAVVVWCENGRWPLRKLAMALRRPMFVLYLGRKSCPLAAPMNPVLIDAPHPVAALTSVSPPSWLRRTSPGAVTCDPFPGESPDQIEILPVEPVDRVKWHFGQAEVWRFDLDTST